MQWEIEIIFKGNRCVFKWEEEFHQGRSLGFYSSVYIRDDETLKEISNDSPSELQKISEMVRQAAAGFRIEELGYFNYTDGLKFKDKIIDIYERVNNNEYVGQYNAEMIYTQEIASILRIPDDRVLKLVFELIEEKKIGLSGNVLIPYETYANGIEYLFKLTGHKKLDRSDSGNWWCESCLKFGDERTNPADTECVRENRERCVNVAP